MSSTILIILFILIIVISIALTAYYFLIYKKCPDNCSDKGNCIAGVCVCSKGYKGKNCSIEDDGSDPDPKKECPNDCSGHGECDTEKGECDCLDGWVGEDCSEETKTICSNQRWVSGNGLMSYTINMDDDCVNGTVNGTSTMSIQGKITGTIRRNDDGSGSINFYSDKIPLGESPKLLSQYFSTNVLTSPITWSIKDKDGKDTWRAV